MKKRKWTVFLVKIAYYRFEYDWIIWPRCIIRWRIIFTKFVLGNKLCTFLTRIPPLYIFPSQFQSPKYLAASRCFTGFTNAMHCHRVCWIIQCSGVQYSAEWCSAVQFGIVQCIVVPYCALGYSTVQWGREQKNVVHYSAVEYITVSVQCGTIHCRGVQYTIVGCSTRQHGTVFCSLVHYSAVCCITVQYGTVLCIVVQYNTECCSTV